MPRAVLAIVALCVVVLVPSSPAGAGFAPTGEEIAGGEQFAATGIAIEGDGDSLIAWSRKQTPASPHEAQARRLSAGGELGPVLDLSPEGMGVRPVIALAGSGRAFAAWQFRVNDGDPLGVKGRWVEPDGALGPLLTLVAGGPGVDAVSLRVAVDPAGVATVAWQNQNDGNRLAVRRVQSDGTLSALVPDISGSGVVDPQIAALPNGSTVAVWRSGGVESNVVNGNLEFGTVVELSTSNATSNAQLAVDSLGNGLAVWRESGVDTYAVKGRRLAPTGAPVGDELTIDPFQTGFVGSQVRVSADSADDFLVTWNRQDAEGDAVVYARGISSEAVFGAPAQPLSSDTGDASAQQTALDDHGTGALVWSEGNGVNVTLGRTLGPFGSSSGPIQELFGKSSGQNEVASAPAAGVAAFLTEYAISGSSRAAVVRRYLVPPACGDSNATVVQGRAIEVPLACTGPAIEGAQVVEGPRRGEVGAFEPDGPALTYTPTPGFKGTDSFTYTALNDGGVSGVARVTIAVGKDTGKPRILSFRLTSKRVGKKKPAGKSPKRRYGFRLELSEPARVRVKVERPARGVRKGKRCVKPGKGPAQGGKRCTRHIAIGRVSSRVALASVALPVRGKLAKKLRKGGRFRATAIATDPAANASKPKRLAFRVKKPRAR